MNLERLEEAFWSCVGLSTGLRISRGSVFVLTPVMRLLLVRLDGFLSHVKLVISTLDTLSSYIVVLNILIIF